jgi:hypothetical protein
MPAWRGYPYDRFSKSVQRPAQWAIIGAAIGIIIGMLTGVNPFPVALMGGLLAGGAGAVSEVRRGIEANRKALETDSSNLSQAPGGSFLSQEHQIIHDCDGNRFQEMISSQKNSAATHERRHKR